MENKGGGYWMLIPGNWQDSLTRPPPSLFSVSLLAAPANNLVSLPLQLMKATVLAESFNFIYFHCDVCSDYVYRHESGRCHSLPFFLIYFLSFYLSRFSFCTNLYFISLIEIQWSDMLIVKFIDCTNVTYEKHRI